MNVTSQTPVLIGPPVAVAVVVSLAYLGANGVDVSAIIDGVKAAATAVVNNSATSATITAAQIATAVAAVPGVASVVSATIAGGASFVGSGGPAYTLLLSSCSVDVKTIV